MSLLYTETYICIGYITGYNYINVDEIWKPKVFTALRIAVDVVASSAAPIAAN